MKIYDVANMGIKDVTVTPSISNIIKPPGVYDGKITVQGDANLVAGNIRNGVSIFGVTGSVVQGAQWASGSATSGSASQGYTGTMDSSGSMPVYLLTVSGLTFTPNRIIIVPPQGYMEVYCYDGGSSYNGANQHHRMAVYSPYYSIGMIDTTASPCYVNNTGFALLVYAPNRSYTWYAYA